MRENLTNVFIRCKIKTVQSNILKEGSLVRINFDFEGLEFSIEARSIEEMLEKVKKEIKRRDEEERKISFFNSKELEKQIKEQFLQGKYGLAK